MSQVEGNGFLYKMVRHISGVLVAVGERKLPPGIVSEMLEVGDNAPPGVCVRACVRAAGVCGRRRLVVGGVRAPTRT